MAKQSKISQVRELAAKIMATMDAIGERSMDAYRECERSQSVGVPLADMIVKGYVTSISDEGMDMMVDTLSDLTVVLEHGLSLFLADIEENVTILAYQRYADESVRVHGMVVEFSRTRMSVKVTDPGSMLAKQDIWVSLLWAPRTTVIVEQ